MANTWTTADIRDDDGWFFPAHGAVYAVYGDGKLIYLGQSGNIRKRMASYSIRFGYSNGTIWTPWGPFGRVWVKFSLGKKYGDWAMRELRLIKRLKPEFNCIGGPRKRSTKEAGV